MEKYLLVGLISRNKDDVDRLIKLESEYCLINNEEDIAYSDLFFDVTHFRVIDTKFFELIDISIDEYYTCDLDIRGISNIIKRNYSNLVEESNNIKYIKLNVNCLAKPDVVNYKSDVEIDYYLKYNNVPVIYDNKPVYGTNIVKLTDRISFMSGYNIRLYLYVNYINGDISVYMEENLVLGNVIDNLDTIYSVCSIWRDCKGLIGIDHVNELLLFGFTASDGYVSNGDTAIIYDFKASSNLIIPSSVTNVIICKRWVVHSDVNCTIVLPPKARLTVAEGFEFERSYNNKVVLMVSNSVSFEDLKEMAVVLGLSHCYYESKEEMADKIWEKLNIKLEFY